MGLQSALGFQFRPPNPAQVAMQRVGSTAAGSWVFQRTLYRIDRPLYRWTDGRMTVPGLLTGLPVIMLTTTGAKSGESRTMPVAGIPFGENLVVLGTNYAQGRTPGWVINLEKEPRATVAWQSRSVPVIAAAVAAERMDEVWQAASVVYVGFPKYRQRIADTRPVRAFVLEPLA
ncbi:MAG: nitroreductase family deazaflavin-dependent oxidoreductase [Actinomycetales bacterium]|nr:nitroreductase family deazaflavin-dependent oxidoreductase [Actinomycetales bacterium]